MIPLEDFTDEDENEDEDTVELGDFAETDAGWLTDWFNQHI